jgi:hypothetical protein
LRVVTERSLAQGNCAGKRRSRRFWVSAIDIGGESVFHTERRRSTNAI